MNFWWSRIVLVEFKVTASTIEQIIFALVCHVVLQLSKCFGSAWCTCRERTPDNHVVRALRDMSESVLQLIDLVTVSALNSDLIDDIVEVTILLLRDEGHLALATLHATLLEPLCDAIFVENLFAVWALDRAVWNAEADWTHEWIYEPSVLLLDVFLAETVRLLKHVFDEILLDFVDESLCFFSSVLFENGHPVRLFATLIVASICSARSLCFNHYRGLTLFLDV